MGQRRRGDTGTRRRGGSQITTIPLLPCGSAAIQGLSKAGKLQSGAAISAQLKNVVPLFPAGAPKWYAQFSSDAQGLINSALKGDMSPQDALKQLSSQASQLASGSS